MSLAFVENGSITQYPIGAVEVRRRFPNTSFPVDIESADLTAFGVVTVHNIPQPSIDIRTEKLEEGTPAFNGTQWNQVWDVLPLSAAEQQAITDSQAEYVRSVRNERLADCDWTQLADSPLDADAKTAWALYRETLRMVPDQPGFPWNVQWPQQP